MKRRQGIVDVLLRKAKDRDIGPAAALAYEGAAAAAMPELVWANAICALITDVPTINTLASAAIVTRAVEVL